jgi:fatty acid CoA ligase FadD9
MQLSTAEWIADDSVPILELTIGGSLRETAARAPDAIALVAGMPEASDRRRWTYAELLEESERAARALLGRFEPGDRVAVWANNIPQWVFLELAAGLAGITLVTVNPALRQEELAYVLGQSRSDGIVYVPEFQGSRMAETLTEIDEELPGLREKISFADWDAFCASGSPTQRLPDVDPGAAAQILYTSGTTGRPKGAVLHHRGVVNSARVYVDALNARGMVQVCGMPLFHIVGCGLTVLGAIASEGTLVLMPYFDPGLLIRLLEEERGECFFGAPTMLTSCLEHPWLADTDVSSVRYIVAAGAPVLPGLASRLENAFDARLCIGFGQTETSGCVSLVLPDDPPEDRYNTIGRPVAQTDMKVIDPATGETVGPDVDGELCTRGYFVMKEYFDRPDATAAAIDADGWLHTGDLAAMDSRGFCRITGRLKDMIIRGGENIYPREIEQVLFEHEDVADVAIVGVPDETWGEQVVAYIRPAEGRVPDPDRLRAYCHERLAPYKVPFYWLTVDDFPTTPSGKVQKFLLRERFATSAPVTTAGAEVQDELLASLRSGGADQPVGEAVRSAVQATLGAHLEDLPGNAKFIDVGGDSLSALRFSRLLEEIFDTEVPVGVVIDPTNDLDQLANYIEKNRNTDQVRPTSATVHGKNASEVRAIDLTLDKFIDAETLTGARALARSRDTAQTVLLTGATGYLGRFLCMEWLQRQAKSDGKLICIARAHDADSARQRIADAFERGDPELTREFRALAADHLQVLAGDVGEPNLGLDEATWHRLAEDVDLVVHVAALVNHVLPYDQLFGPNVLGSAEVIRLALTSKRKPLNYISTVAVAVPGDVVLSEDDDIRTASAVRKIDDTYANGYANSKWAGEVLLREAHDLCGLPAAVFRCDMILAHRRYAGQLNVSDLFTRLMLSLVATGIAPRSFYEFDGQRLTTRAHYDGLPVDFIAEAIATLGANATDGFHTYHVVNPHDDGISVDQFVDWLIAAGNPIERVDDYGDWLTRFESAMRALPDRQRQYSELNLLDAFKPPAPGLHSPALPADVFRAAVRKSCIGPERDIPQVSPDLIGKYVTDLRQLELL